VKNLFIIGIIGFVILCVVVSIIVTNILERKRREAIRILAEELHFEFFPGGKADLLAAMSPFRLFNVGRSRLMKNLMRGVAGGIELDIFDYRYTTGSGKSQQTFSFTVLSARTEDMDLPQFSLRPESFWNKIGNILGLRDIDFDTNPKFSSLYHLKGADESAIRSVFRPEVLEYFAQHPKLNVEGSGDTLIYFVGSRLAANKVRDFMAEGFAVLNLFRSADGQPTDVARADG
jgi:hypothetical protein